MLVDKLKSALERTNDITDLAKELEISEGAIVDLALYAGLQVNGVLYEGKAPKNGSVHWYCEYEKIKEELKKSKQLVAQLRDSLQVAGHHEEVSDALRNSLPATYSFNNNVSSSREATVFLLASDWHVGEYVNGDSINNLNHYTLKTAKDRAETFFTNAVRLIEKERHDVAVNKLVLWIGGDIITGYIHPELEESNNLSPVEEVLFAQELFYNGIQYLQKHTGIEDLTIVCNYGNHGRTTVKKRVSTGARNSYEWLMYKNLAQLLPQFTWLIPEGYFQYLKVYNKTIRFHHGDSLKGGDGVGGVTIPLNKFIAKCNYSIPADMDVLGHFHSLLFYRNFVINGSLIGPSAYSLTNGYPCEPAQQGFLVLDSEYGFTTRSPILV